MNIDMDMLQRFVAEGLISETKHPVLPLWIYNYTPQCVYAHAWNELTLLCRGLILDEYGRIVERPFEKFFNIEEHSRSDILFREPFQVFEKMDGSLGILYRSPEGLAVATRGSFQSEQAIWATQWLRAFQPDYRVNEWTPDPSYTYLFEIIYKNNRIVVDYGAFEGLVFLAAVHKNTGASMFTFGDERDYPGLHVKRFDSEDMKPHDLLEIEKPNEEGFVVFFPNSNRRVKAKMAEYVRVHRIVTGTNTKRIWEWLASGQDITEMLDHVPDEFYDFVRGTVTTLSSKAGALHAKAKLDHDRIMAKLGPNCKRKDFAMEALKYRNNSLIFALHDGKSIDDAIWKMVKPARAEWYSQYDVAEET